MKTEWLRSRYDERWHAFPAEQETDWVRPFLAAACEHSVPAELVERTVPSGISALCPTCVLAMGELLSDAVWWSERPVVGDGSQEPTPTRATSDPMWTVSVACSDIAGRRRVVDVMPRAGERVVVMVPPGEAAVLSVDEATELHETLRTATLVAAGVAEPAWVANSFRRTIPCSDGLGRARAMAIATNPSGPVVLSAPPGGVAVFRPMEVVLLLGVLRDAITSARGRLVVA